MLFIPDAHTIRLGAELLPEADAIGIEAGVQPVFPGPWVDLRKLEVEFWQV
jgi:hypothetical protein